MNSFNQRKKSILSKKDKSKKGKLDSRIISLCKKLNLMENYYTTSSCSGKCTILEEEIGKKRNYYLWTNHNLINFKELNEIIQKINSKKTIKFKCESPIIFVNCQNIDSAKNLMIKAVNSGFKETGIKITNKLIGVEIKSGEKLEFPIMKKGKSLIPKEFLLEIVNQSNLKRNIGWEKIKKLATELR
jgi:tRNA wybutosine-synthesizing protein 3